MPDVQKRLAAASAEPMGLTPAETASFMREEVERWAAVIRTAHVRLE
jgi:tripartite-type tricarboxylate transporter receptor subunit TctC